MQVKFYVVPIRQSEQIEAEINTFLSSVRVINIQREFVAEAENSLWCLAVEYLPSNTDLTPATKKKSRIDYREALSPEDFALFAKLRDWRKEMAGKESNPVYTICTNDQLAEIATQKITTLNL